jgi:RNA polymerase sigma-70 factor (ECF subfamily)
MPTPDARPSPEQAFRASAGRVYHLARRLLTNDADAEDVTQGVLLRVVLGLDAFRGESALFTWLYRVTVNAAIDLRRQPARRREGPLQDCQEGRWSAAQTPDRQAQSQELRRLLEGAIAGLPERARGVFLLSDIEGLPDAEVGRRLGLKPGTVRSRLHRARRMLRGALAPHFVEGGA